LPLMR